MPSTVLGQVGEAHGPVVIYQLLPLGRGDNNKQTNKQTNPIDPKKQKQKTIPNQSQLYCDESLMEEHKRCWESRGAHFQGPLSWIFDEGVHWNLETEEDKNL